MREDPAFWFAFAEMRSRQTDFAFREERFLSVTLDASPRASSEAMQSAFSATLATISGASANRWNDFRLPVRGVVFEIEAH